MAIDTEALFTVVYRAHYEDVLRFVSRRAHPMNVDDIVGETFLTAWRRRHELPDDPRPWLFGTARNVMLNAGRGMRRQSSLVVRIQQTFRADGDDSKADFAGRVDDRLGLSAAWQALSEGDQEVLSLHVWEELTAQQAGQVLGCSRATFAMRLTRARRRLARLVDPDRQADVSLAATR
ncbi:RNA polymerase sigma factor [Streptomyces sp. NBC_00568]|uniref:RNA polymerase sigma factor n=1 Tax=Streptomyces sp. NBC_00568 TaxID=2975779 RepID=UPI0022531376|nr:sigma-70 family RNA polymerase sigma factor [Streptomyces sp. NBC_00568]MCX4993524.1 sigma-70 family RNA polymerase sigma factor [Streptomyces sp. NBC_00568]